MDMMRTDELVPLVRRKITGPLDITLCEALQGAAVIFCRESAICRETITLHGIQANQPCKLTPATSGLIVIKILSVRAQADCHTSHNSVTFTQPQHSAEILCVLAPELSGHQLPEIPDGYWPCLVHGALAELHIMPGKAWYNPDLSAFHQQRFTDGYRRAYQQTLNHNPVSGYSQPPRRGVYF